jgi:hypothetical protein
LAAAGAFRERDVLVVQDTGWVVLGVTEDFQRAQIGIGDRELDVAKAADVGVSVQETVRLFRQSAGERCPVAVRGAVYDGERDSIQAVW